MSLQQVIMMPVRWALVILFLTVIGCNDGGDSSGGGGHTDDTNDSVAFKQKTNLDEASYDEISDYVALCEGHSDKICVYLCHRPPGNPEKSKNMVLPLTAVQTHLNHHGSHQHKDYLGDCHSQDSTEDEGSSEDSDDGAETDEESSNADNEGTGDSGLDEDLVGGEIPQWCHDVIDIDTNCDGYNDATMEPLF